MIMLDNKMPERCGQCPCFHAENPMHCQATKPDKNKRIVAPYGMPKPEWCPLKECEKTVWIVSWYNRGEMPVVTPFNNEDAAKRYYDYELNNNHEKVDLDKCEVYSTFTQFGG